jgi:hypothetical protein
MSRHIREYYKREALGYTVIGFHDDDGKICGVLL